MQLAQERDLATYPVTLWYRTHFEADFIPENLRLLIDGFSGSTHQLYINGKVINDPGRRSSLDAEIKEVAIASCAHAGKNTVAVRLCVQRRTDGILDLLKLVGDFALEQRGNGHFAMILPSHELTIGDWTVQGYPFFSGVGVYSCEFDLPQAYCEGKLFLEADCGEDVLEVSINENKSKVAPWHPYRLDVSDVVQPGSNKIELCVTNTLINVLEGVSKSSGLFAPVRLVHHHTYQLARHRRK
jgi:hypothetical protein